MAPRWHDFSTLNPSRGVGIEGIDDVERELAGTTVLPIGRTASSVYRRTVEETLRQRKKRGTRQRLVASALDLFNERGFDGVTVQDIVDRADVSQRTFFRYFGSKEAVLFADMHELLVVLREAIAQQPPGLPALDVLQNAMRSFVQHWVLHRDDHAVRIRLAETGAAIAAYQRAVLQPQWEEALADDLADHLDVEVDRDPRPRLLAGVALAVMSAVGGSWIESEQRADVTELLDQAFNALFDSVRELGGPG